MDPLEDSVLSVLFRSGSQPHYVHMFYGEEVSSSLVNLSDEFACVPMEQLILNRLGISPCNGENHSAIEGICCASSNSRESLEATFSPT